MTKRIQVETVDARTRTVEDAIAREMNRIDAALRRSVKAAIDSA